MNGYQITHFIGTDGVPVVQIDTAERGGMIRVNLNDAPIYNGNPEIHDAPGISLITADDDDDDLRECERCGDEVESLSTRDWCDGCESLEICDECDEEATNFWTELKKPVQLCDSCEHNARRSGWEPGQ